jgi:Sec-independent protein secretion pathway component TatC
VTKLAVILFLAGAGFAFYIVAGVPIAAGRIGLVEAQADPKALLR